MTVENGRDEMVALRLLLEDAGIDYTRIYALAGKYGGRNQIIVSSGKTELSAICQYGSYGYDEGLIECWDFAEEHDPIGNLTAEGAYAWIIAGLGEEA